MKTKNNYIVTSAILCSLVTLVHAWPGYQCNPKVHSNITCNQLNIDEECLILDDARGVCVLQWETVKSCKENPDIIPMRSKSGTCVNLSCHTTQKEWDVIDHKARC